MNKKQKKRLTTGIIIVALIIGILYFGVFRPLSFTNLGDVYDSDFYSIGGYSITLSALTRYLNVIPAQTWGADLTDNRIQRYDIIWGGQGKVLNENCSISSYVINPSDDPIACGNRQVNVIGKATNQNGILLCQVISLPCSHSKDKFNSPIITWTFIDPLIQFYRLQNNNCIETQLTQAQRTANDYTTLNECQSKIISPPPPPEPTGFWALLQKINDWIANLFKKIFG